MADERIKQGQQKIWSEMGRIMYFLATGSFLLKSLALHKSLEDCIIEFLILIGVPVVWKNVFVGLLIVIGTIISAYQSEHSGAGKGNHKKKEETA